MSELTQMGMLPLRNLVSEELVGITLCRYTLKTIRTMYWVDLCVVIIGNTQSFYTYEKWQFHMVQPTLNRTPLNDQMLRVAKHFILFLPKFIVITMNRERTVGQH